MEWDGRISEAYEDCRKLWRNFRQKLAGEECSMAGDRVRLDELAGERTRCEAEIQRLQQILEDRNRVLARRLQSPKDNDPVGYNACVWTFHPLVFFLTWAMIVLSYFAGDASESLTGDETASVELTLKIVGGIAAGATVVAWTLGYLFSTFYRTRQNVVVLALLLAILMAAGGGASAADIISAIPRLPALIVLSLTSGRVMDNALSAQQAIGLAAYAVAFLTGTWVWRVPNPRLYYVTMHFLAWLRPDRETEGHLRALDRAFGELHRVMGEQAKLESRRRHALRFLLAAHRREYESRAELLYATLLKLGRTQRDPDGDRRAKAARKWLVAQCLLDVDELRVHGV
jgi:hypothetical protein